MADASSDSGSARREGLALLRQVYEELYSQLGDDFSPAELLKAAQTLIDITNEEYSVELFQDGQLHPGYYSYEVDRMIKNRYWWPLSVEDNALDEQDDMQDYRLERAQWLKQIYNPDPYFHRG